MCREALDASCTFCFSHILVAARVNKSCSLKYVFVPPILSHVITARRLFVGFCKNWLGLWQFLLLSYTSLSLRPHHILGELSPRQCGHRPEDKLSIFTMFSQYAFLAILCVQEGIFKRIKCILKDKSFYEKIFKVTLHNWHTLTALGLSTLVYRRQNLESHIHQSSA